ncbi:hypothetical protein DICPUDRAFT_31219 [Dictyostelium purpureum]|uniref:Anaphase-promoting complex subunit CDC26 n=1 Tax=Dictyostelium purpureum TaxID=5786 RepID=F0ZGU9_DICPU|nr:uncharacterized protein DICPUDRAFT_31219 [Dictyostelium purpureum]EGC36852.1 hypothetical protein DICPUDRAFT_31219 [Dictyostelium purpureum]|eukprot:XP_003286650.1 hypothetical protein DICPUDRAFT_31219 [Dictyostelium purpureum]
MINRKPTRIELNMEDIEEYEDLKKEQTEAASKISNNNQLKKEQFPLTNTSNPPKKTTAQIIGYEK